MSLWTILGGELVGQVDELSHLVTLVGLEEEGVIEQLGGRGTSLGLDMRHFEGHIHLW